MNASTSRRAVLGASLSALLAALAALAVSLAPAGAEAQGHAAADIVMRTPPPDPGSLPPPRAVRYNVSVADDLRSATVTICMEGGTARRLVPSADGAEALITNPVRLTSMYELPLPLSDGAIDVSTLQPDECARFGVDQSRDAGPPERPLVRHVGKDVVVDPGAWLWRPDRGTEADTTLLLRVPDGKVASVPWTFVRGDAGPYRVSATAFHHPARVAIGELEREVIRVAGGDLDVVVLSGKKKASARGIQGWLREAGRASAFVYGTPPSDRIQVIVEPVESVGDWPVPYSEVTRGGGPCVHLRISAEAKDTQLAADDTMALHAFAHLLLPELGPDADWLEEGIATYYQEVLRARAGALPPEEVMARLERGFQVARAQQAQTSAVASRGQPGAEPVGDQAWHRWAGVAYALAADVRLRSMNTGDSLDGALAALRTCCLESGQTRNARALVDLLDGETRTNIFTTLYDETAATTGVPSLERLYEILGMGVDGERVATTNDAPFAYVRIGIFSAR